jgi:hypothetical protein
MEVGAKWSFFSSISIQMPVSWSYVQNPSFCIWKSSCEPRSKFFSWPVMHNKVLTADNMIKKSWPCNPMCALCFYVHETTSHLLTECNFSKATWNLIAQTFNLPNYQEMVASGGPDQWLNFLQRMGSKELRRKNSGILITFW